MSDVDKRVVKFEFDNSKFERNVKQSMSTLDKLKESLNFKGVSNNLDKVSVKISAMEVAAVTALSRISNKVIDLGVNLVKSLSIDNIANGWTKFGDKTIAVATLMSQTIKIAGKQIDDYAEKMSAINSQLDKLNWFTDETSYNFTDMVNTIGKFTAAGKDLDQSVEAIMGIATWAALSGQNAATASRAMYQLAQASGRAVQLMDYRSIQNANMDTQEFRQTVLDTAVAIGELTKVGQDYITKTGEKFTISQFVDKLSAKWFTSDVLLKTLEKYSAGVDKLYEISIETGLTATEVIARYGDEVDVFGLKAFKAAQEARTLSDAVNAIKDAVSTGWMTTAEKIFGAYTESKVLWTDLANELYDVFAEGGNFRNEILSIWRELDGYSDLFTHGTDKQGAFWNMYDSIVAFIDIFKKSFASIFPKSLFGGYADQIADLGNKLKTFTKTLQTSTSLLLENLTNSERFGNILKGLFSVLKVGLQLLQGIRYALDPIIKTVLDIGDELVDLASRIGLSLTKTERVTEIIFNVAQKIHDVLASFVEFVNPRGILRKAISLITSLTNAIVRFFKELDTSGIKDFFGDLNQKIKDLFSNFEGLNGIINKITNGFKKFINTAKSLVSSSKSQNGSSGTENIESALEPMTLSLTHTAQHYAGPMVEMVAQTSDIIAETNKETENLVENLTIFQRILNSLKSICNSIKKIIVTIGDALTTVFETIEKAFVYISELDFKTIAIAIGVTAGVALLVAIIIKIIDIAYYFMSVTYGLGRLIDGLATYLERISLAKELESIANIIKNIALLLISLAATFYLFTFVDIEAIGRGALAISTMAIAISGVIVASKLFKSKIEVLSGTLVSTNNTLTGSLLPALNGIGNSVKAIAAQVGGMFILPEIIRGFGFAILEIAVAFNIFNKVNKNGIITGTVTMVVLALAISGMMALTSLVKDKNTALRKAYPSLFQFIGLALLLGKIAKVISDLASIDPKKMIAPFAGVIATLIALYGGLAILAKASTNSKEMASIIKATKGLVVSMLPLAWALQTLSKIEPDKLEPAVRQITNVLIVLLAGVSVLSAISNSLFDANETSKILKSLALVITSLLPLALAIKTITKLDPKKVSAAIDDMLLVLGALTLFIIALMTVEHYAQSNIDKTVLSMAALVSSLLILAASIKLLSKIEIGWDLLIPISGIIGLLIALYLLVRWISKLDVQADDVKILNILKGFIKALAVVITAISILAKSEPGPLAIAMGGVILLIGALSLLIFMLSKINPNDNAVKLIKNTIYPLIAALASVIAAMSLLKDADIWTLVTIMGGLSVFLLVFAGAILMLSNIKGYAPKANAALKYILALTGTIAIFASSMKIMQGISWQSMLTATLGMISTLAAMSIAIVLISKAKLNADTLRVFSATLIKFSLSMILLSIAMADFSTIGVNAALGLILTAAGVAALGLALKLLNSFILIRFAISMLLLATSMAEFSKIGSSSAKALISTASGILVMAIASKLLVGVVSALIKFSVAALLLGAAVFLLSSGMDTLTASTVPFADSLINAFISLVQAIPTLGPELINALITIINSVLDAIIQTAPKLVSSLMYLVQTALEALLVAVPTLTKTLIQIVTAFINVLTDNLPTLIDSLINFITTLITSALNAFTKDRMTAIIDALFTFVLNLISALGETIKNRAADTVETFVEFGKNLMAGLWNGIVEGLAQLISLRGGKFGTTVADWLRDELMISSPSKMTEEMGMYLMAGLGKGIDENVDKTSKDVAESMTKVIANIRNNMDDIDDSLVITPILDLSNVQAGARDISSMMSGINGRSTTLSANLASSAMSGFNAVQSSKRAISQNGTSTVNNQTDNYYSTFNITTDDPEELARETDIILQRNRRMANLAKGGV